jgi:hypothetical protein
MLNYDIIMKYYDMVFKLSSIDKAFVVANDNKRIPREFAEYCTPVYEQRAEELREEIKKFVNKHDIEHHEVDLAERFGLWINRIKRKSFADCYEFDEIVYKYVFTKKIKEFDKAIKNYKGD